MEAWKVLSVLLLSSLLVSSGHCAPHSDYQGDDWSVSHLVEETMDQYVKPHTGGLVDSIKSSRLWTFLGNTADRVQGVVNYTGEYLSAYYDDHLRKPIEEGKEWIKVKADDSIVANLFRKVWPKN